MNIITLTLNPAIDVHCELDFLKPCMENKAQIIARDAGGKGINISRALCNVDCENVALVAVANENEKEFLTALDADKLSYKAFSQNGRIRENITVHHKDLNETRISFDGFSLSDKAYDDILKCICSLCNKDSVLTVTGSLPKGLDFKSFKDFVLKLSLNGVKIVIDSKDFSLDDIIDVKPWLIKPNAEEISVYLDKEVKDFPQIETEAKRLVALGVENVMVSLGEKGAMLVSRKGTFVASAPKIEPVSTIGAGDSMIAGFIYAHTLGLCSNDKLKYAVAFGSAACLESGTRPPQKQNVKKLLDMIN